MKNQYIKKMDLNCLEACVDCHKYCTGHEQLIKKHILKSTEVHLLRNKDTAHLYFIQKGCVHIIHEENMYANASDSIFFIPKNINSHCIVIEDAILFSVPVMTTIDLCSTKVIDILKEQVKVDVYRFTTLKSTEGVHIFFKLLNELFTLSMSCVYLHELKIVELLLCLKQEYSMDQIGSLFYPLIKEANSFKEIVQKSFTPAITINDLAATTGMPYPLFLKYFKTQFGVTAQAWLRANRVKILEERLSDIDTNFSDIIREFNFSSAAHFTKFCIQNFGENPSTLVLKKKNIDR